MVCLTRDLLATRQDGLDCPKLNDGQTSLGSLHDPRDQLSNLVLELVHSRISLRFANLLNDHLLGGLSTDATDLFLVQFPAIAGGADRPAIPCDLHVDVRFFAELLLGCHHQRSFDRLEHQFRVDVLLAVQRIDDP
jgi:hypothetical protein